MQKKAYKLLAYLCEERPSFVQAHASSILATLTAALPSAQSAAKRYRLRCLRVAVTLARRDQAQQSTVNALVAEVVLGVKESNLKARVSAYELLVQLAHDMQPHVLVTVVMGGLVGSSPSMVSASVMALARLLYEFPQQLVPLVPRLLPAVLMLLRSKNREVVKAVLGFVKVAVLRTPEEALRPFVGDILTAVLLWADDSKNRFKAKVRGWWYSGIFTKA